MRHTCSGLLTECQAYCYTYTSSLHATRSVHVHIDSTANPPVTTTGCMSPSGLGRMLVQQGEERNRKHPWQDASCTAGCCETLQCRARHLALQTLQQPASELGHREEEQNGSALLNMCCPVGSCDANKRRERQDSYSSSASGRRASQQVVIPNQRVPSVWCRIGDAAVVLKHTVHYMAQLLVTCMAAASPPPLSPSLLPILLPARPQSQAFKSQCTAVSALLQERAAAVHNCCVLHSPTPAD